MKIHGDNEVEKRHKRQSKQSTRIKGVFDDRYAQMAMSDDSNSGKSDITVEFSPNRTDNTFTNKRKRQEESADGVESKKVILGFRLPLKKQNPSTEKKTVEVEAEQIVKKPLIKRPWNNNVQVEAEKPLKICPEKNKDIEVEPEKLFTRRLEKNTEEAVRSTTVDAKKHKSSRSKRSSMYKMLIEDWVPPSIDQMTKQQVDEEDDWLFGSRKKQEHDNGDRDQEYYLSTGLLPQATHFPEIDIYALPYAILF